MASRSLAYFFALYLPHYLKAQTPEFHYEIFEDLENDDIRFLEIIGFRGSAKSTIGQVAFALWCALYQKRNFIILLSDTGNQARQAIKNIVHEFENNQRIQNDFGQSSDKNQEWAATNIFMRNGVRITAMSRGQKVRGLRHLEFRPDLIIADDIENLDDVHTIEQRNRTEEWLMSDVLPAIDQDIGRVVLIGNLLHDDSLLSRIKKKIYAGDQQGVCREYPLITPEGVNTWKEIYPDERVKEIERQLGKRYFMREYLLQIVASEEQLIEDVSYYDTAPELESIAIGVDLAISKKEGADFTSINVSGKDIDGKIYNLRSIKGHWNFNETLNKINEVFSSTKTAYPEVSLQLGIEDVAYQKAAIEEVYRRFQLPVQAIKQTQDKRANLETYVPYLENGQILFKRSGMEDLIIQLLYFGSEAHDDCLDAAMIAWRMLVNEDRVGVQWI